MTTDLGPSRRDFLSAAGMMAAAAGLGPLAARGQALSGPGHRLTVRTRVIEVDGRPATVFGITGEGGRSGLELTTAEGFHVELRNEGPEATIVHWHGLTPPFRFDGNTVSQDPIAPGASMDFAFGLARAGTNWMHSHLGLQEQLLLAAPLIVRDAADDRVDRRRW